MADISFYHLHSSPLGKALPKLLEKAYGANLRTVVLTADEACSEELNKNLWTYTTKFFLPHGTKADGYSDRQPIYITAAEENPNNAKVLVMTHSKSVVMESDFSKHFNRFLYMFDGNNEEELVQARNCWKSYKDEGHTLLYWQQNDKGAWEKKASA